MRLMVTNLTYDEVKPHLKKLVDRLYQRVPAGVGSTGFVKLSRKDFRQVVEQGARWCVQNGFGWEEDLELMEENGCMRVPILPRLVKRQLIEVSTKLAPRGLVTTI
jgi:tRNA-splicing ligase RtcB